MDAGRKRRCEQHYMAEKRKPEVLKLWAAHVKKEEIVRRTGLTMTKVSDIIHHALVDGEIEEIRVIHSEVE